MLVKKITLTAKEGQREELAKLLQGMVVPSRMEEGCLQYDLFQYQDQPGTFFLLEVWQDDDCFAAHRETAHFVDFKAKAPEVIETKENVALNKLVDV